MSRKKITTLLALCGALAATGANATMVTFDFRRPGSDDQHQLTYSLYGATIIVSAFKNSADASIHRAATKGLGVTGSPLGGAYENEMAYGDDGTGNIVAESLLIEMGNVPLILSSLVLNNFNATEAVDVFVDSDFLAQVTQATTIDLTPGSPASDRQWTAPDPLTAIAYNSFRIVAAGGGVRLASLTFEIPEPGSLAMVALGLAGIAARRRVRPRQP